jgi:hypothetical protein
MVKDESIINTSVLVAKASTLRGFFKTLITSRKKLLVGVVILLIGVFLVFGRSKPTTSVAPHSVKVQVAKSYDMSALTTQGKVSTTKIKFSIDTVEKTDQVLVKDQVFTAKNNKMFLIVNLQLKNDATSALNILPGDLVRLSYGSSPDNKFAPDLHNNLVLVSAISTKTDRVGFVIPNDVRSFKIFVGELEGKKEEINVDFPS